MVWVILGFGFQQVFIGHKGIWMNVSGDIRIYKGDVRIRGISLEFVGGKVYNVEGLYPTGGKFSYFGPHETITGKMFKSLRLKDIYPKVDFVINGLSGNTFEFYLHIKPYADPNKIRLNFAGCELKDKNGKIEVIAENGERFIIKDLKAYQGAREVKVKPLIKGSTLYFKVENYDPSSDLIIDPTFVIGGSSMDFLRGIHVDDSGYVYVVGYTYDYGSFLMPNYIYGSLSNPLVFVVRLSPDLMSVLSVAFISGSDEDMAAFITEDPNGNILVLGYTKSNDIAPSRTVYGVTGAGDIHVFLTKLSHNLDVHIKTVLISSAEDDYGWEVLIDAPYLYIIGSTYGSPTFGLSRNVIGGDTCEAGDIFITKLDTALNYITTSLICGFDQELAWGGLLLNNSLYVFGMTHVLSWDARVDTLIGIRSSYDAYLVKVNKNLDTILRAVIFGGNYGDYIRGILADNSGNLYIFFWTENASSFATGIPSVVYGTLGAKDMGVIWADTSLRNFYRMAYVSSPDTEKLYLRTMALKGDTIIYVLNIKSNPPSWGSCPVCNITSGDTSFWDTDPLIVGLSKDLNTCYGVSNIGGIGEDYARYTLVYPDRILVGGYFFRGYDTTSYPQPYIRYNPYYSPNDEAFLIEVSPRCLVDVKEKAERKGLEVYISRGGITVILSSPSYLGFDLYSPDGRRKHTKSLGFVQPGKYSIPLDVPKGVYFVRIRVGDKVITKRVFVP